MSLKDLYRPWCFASCAALLVWLFPCSFAQVRLRTFLETCWRFSPIVCLCSRSFQRLFANKRLHGRIDCQGLIFSVIRISLPSWMSKRAMHQGWREDPLTNVTVMDSLWLQHFYCTINGSVIYDFGESKIACNSEQIFILDRLQWCGALGILTEYPYEICKTVRCFAEINNFVFVMWQISCIFT